MPMGKNKEHDEYIKSSKWKQTREWFFNEIYDEKCYFCGRKKSDGAIIQLHHNDYTHFKDEMNHPDDVIPMCASCHRALHFAKHNRGRFNKKNDEDTKDNVRKSSSTVKKQPRKQSTMKKPIKKTSK